MRAVFRSTSFALLTLGSLAASAQQSTAISPLYLWSNPEQRLSWLPPAGNQPAIPVSGGSEAWALVPVLQTPVTLASGDVQVRLLLTRRCDLGWLCLFFPASRHVTVELTNSALGVVASIVDLQLSNIPSSTPGEYTITLEIPASITAPAGSTFGLTVSYDTYPGLGVNVWPLSGGNTSRVELNVALPTLQVLKVSQVLSDPINNATNPKSIPGAVQLYTLRITNQGGGVVDSDSLAVTDAIPDNTAMYVMDTVGAGSGPVAFVDGAPTSRLAYTFTALNSATDHLEFSSDSGATWSYTPVPDADGYDAAITHIRVRPQGSLAGNGGTGNPWFEIRFRVRVE